MIDVHSKEANIVEALNCWDKMIADGCSPNVVTYTVLINNLCKSGYLSSAEIRCKEMLAGRFLPNSFTYNCFLNYMATEGELEKAKVLHAAMLKGCLANTVTFNTLIKGFCKVGQIQEAIDLMQKITESGFFPDCISYSTIINELSKMGKHK
jgi:pentatricopeptide repeat protein